MPERPFAIRHAQDEDRVPLASLFAAVAQEREGIAERGLHQLSLGVFPHNDAAIALYRKHGFEVEGRRCKHIRRANGGL